MIDLDLYFISGKLLRGEVERDKEWLRNYFRQPLGKMILAYYLYFMPYYKEFGFKNFRDQFISHTGYVVEKRWFMKAFRRVRLLEAELEKAMKDFDVELVAKIKSGKFPITRLKW